MSVFVLKKLVVSFFDYRCFGNRLKNSKVLFFYSIKAKLDHCLKKCKLMDIFKINFQFTNTRLSVFFKNGYVSGPFI